MDNDLLHRDYFKMKVMINLAIDIFLFVISFTQK